MTVIKLANHSSSRIFKAIQKMVQDHGFKYNQDLSDTEVGKLDREFKIIFRQVDNSARSNNQNMRTRATVEIALFHNAEKNTAETQVRILDDVENIVFEIDRFAPSGKFSDVTNIVSVTEFLRWITEPTKQGDDSRLRTIVLFEIEYKIRNPAQGV